MDLNTHDDEIALGERLEELIGVGKALSSEKNFDRLFEIILSAAQRLTHADGGTLYRVCDGQLRFEILRTNSLGLAMGGTTGVAIPFDTIPLYDPSGRPNSRTVVACSVLQRRTINMDDVYAAADFDCSGTREIDGKTGYRSQSFLTVPMENHEGEIIGVLQLINATDGATGAVRTFSRLEQRLVESLASQAAIALTNRNLIDQLEHLFESFVGMLNAALDEKSPYTGAHCQRVPVLTMMLAEAASNAASGPLASFHMSDQDRHELKIAGLLHDCGKITTPVHIVDKATKLETIMDRIHLVHARFEIVKRDAELTLWRGLSEASRSEPDGSAQARFHAFLEALEADRAFLERCNAGTEFMAKEDQERVRQIAGRYQWRIGDERRPLLSDEEVRNLTVSRGTLTPEERAIINGHIVSTIHMLEAMDWPRHLRNVPEYAGGHHERMDGRGYPKGLTREQMSVQARIVAIADIFEALTAKDRPYKRGKTLTEALTILGQMKLDGHIDPDLFDVFLRERVYERYAQAHLDADQIEKVDPASIPGCPPDLFP
ncbi:MAG: GAF domain-containing protein [Betaproteobacteria bacterium]|nr:GAF domain-containing protein [Betaproteobacteria bacterium]